MEHEQDKQAQDFSPSQAHQHLRDAGTDGGASSDRKTSDTRTLSAEQSAQLAGVSLDTIEKYVSIGLLTPVEQQNEAGLARFLESDIRSLFYTRKAEAVREYDKDLPPTSSQLASASEEKEASEEEQEQPSAFGETAASSALRSAQQEAEEPKRTEDWAMQEALEAASMASASKAETEALSADAEAAEPAPETPEKSATETTASGPTPEPGQHLNTGSSAEEAASVKKGDTEMLTKSLREQIEVLKEERDWLRTRIEQLELRSEREQMLLLSESETVRRLVSQRSIAERVMQTFRLPWLQSEKK